MERATIIEVIRRCLALSQSNNEHEAAAAAAKALELLVKHKLSMAEVQDVSQAEDITITPFDLAAGDKKWRRSLASVVGRYNFCRVLAYRGRRERGRTVLFVGKPTDAGAAIEVYTWLSRKIEGLARAKQILYGRTYRTSFCWGAVLGVENALAAQQSTDRAKEQYALIRAEEAGLDLFVQETYGRTRTLRKGRLSIDAEGYADGVAAGRTISTRPPTGLPGSSGALPEGR